MEKIDNILVCLDLTEMDDFLIRYANFLVEKTNPKKNIFLHLLQQYDLPREVMSEFPNLDKPLKNLIQEELEEKVKNSFVHPQNVKYQIKVEEGNKLETLLQFTRDNKIDLTIFGKKVGYEGAGAFAHRIMPLTPSSIILVSETIKPEITKILVRMDFSKMSELAMRKAVDLSQKTGAKVFALNAYHLPISHFPQYSASDEERLQKKMVKHGQKEYQKFMKKLKLDPEKIPCTYVYDKNFDEARILYHHGLMNQADLIMIGSKVKSELANVILDRTTEDLGEVEKNIPVLIVKDRKQMLGFLEALID